MNTNIKNITSNQILLKESLPLKNTKLEKSDFADKLKSVMENVNSRQNNSDTAVEKVISGELGIHEAMLNLQEADTTLKLFMQTRNKVLDAYREIMRMQF